MDIRGWDERYRSASRPAEDLEAAPNPLLVETAKRLAPGDALDLACGAGRNALWLAEQGWNVTAVDGSAAAIEILRKRSTEKNLSIETRVADLEAREYIIESGRWDFVAICYYLQLDLIEKAKIGLRPGGVLLVIVHIAEPGEQPTGHRLRPGELIQRFKGWTVLHSFEGNPNDPAHKRAVAEVVARKS